MIETQPTESSIGAIACRPCPAFTTLATLRPSASGFALQTVVYGTFTSAYAQQAVADFAGCEDHASSANFQGSVLLTKGTAGWQMTGYERIDTSNCQLYGLPEGRDVLVCDEFEGHVDQSWEGISVLDFSKPDGELVHPLLYTTDTSEACGPTAVLGKIDHFEIRDLDGDGQADVRVEVRVAEEKATAQGNVCTEFPNPPQRQVDRVDFLFKDGRFVVAPWSVATKTRLDAMFRAER
jgi:hypothetical protein